MNDRHTTYEKSPECELDRRFLEIRRELSRTFAVYRLASQKGFGGGIVMRRRAFGQIQRCRLSRVAAHSSAAICQHPNAKHNCAVVLAFATAPTRKIQRPGPKRRLGRDRQAGIFCGATEGCTRGCMRILK
jgi:hypothetical protein